MSDTYLENHQITIRIYVGFDYDSLLFFMESHLLSYFGIEGELIMGYNQKKIYYEHAKEKLL